MTNSKTYLLNKEELSFAREAFSRTDESGDEIFYSHDRLVPHLDALALETVTKLVEALVVEEKPVILDLMASFDSHIPDRFRSGRMVGLGLNEKELRSNPALSDIAIHDLNRDPRLPFADTSFDIVLNTVSVDYMTRPVEVFKDVARILKPGGLFLVIFSNRMFPEKAVKVWRESGEDERILLVEDYFRESEAFGPTKQFVSKGRPRPRDDKYVRYGIPSDPVYAVYAEKPGAAPGRPARPPLRLFQEGLVTEGELDRKKRWIKHTLKCPYCDERMERWAVPDNPFEVTWNNEFLYICFNDQCSYYVRGWDHIYRTTQRLASYRFMYNPDKDVCLPIPVPSPKALRESIIR
jgi:SAM-dependent methyltransferase